MNFQYLRENHNLWVRGGLDAGEANTRLNVVLKQQVVFIDPRARYIWNFYIVHSTSSVQGLKEDEHVDKARAFVFLLLNYGLFKGATDMNETEWKTGLSTPVLLLWS